MKGYLRQDGRKGIRNTVVVAYLIECARHVSNEIALEFRGQIPIPDLLCEHIHPTSDVGC